MMMLKNYRVLFWDFDGVIKESVDVKTQAYIELFQDYGADVAEQVRYHHETNGGMSRFEKLPLYLKWAGEVCHSARVGQFCDKFASMVVNEVIKSAWVPGVEGYLRSNPYGQIFIVVSATPQDELIEILSSLCLLSCFTHIYGAPTPKKDALRTVLQMLHVSPEHCLMIGDADVDFDAANANDVPFLLRRHATNGDVFVHYTGPSVNDFSML